MHVCVFLGFEKLITGTSVGAVRHNALHLRLYDGLFLFFIIDFGRSTGHFFSQKKKKKQTCCGHSSRSSFTISFDGPYPAHPFYVARPSITSCQTHVCHERLDKRCGGKNTNTRTNARISTDVARAATVVCAPVNHDLVIPT